MSIYYQDFHYLDLKLLIVVNDRKLVYVGSGERRMAEAGRWARKHFEDAELVESQKETEEAADQILQYLRGDREGFDIPYELIGTAFQQKVWQVVSEIPYGETRTYGEVAEQIGRPTAQRAVANAIGANPLLFICPCHRIIGKNGKLTGYRGGMPMKEGLLRLEGQRIR